MAQIMRPRELVSEVPAQQATTTAQPAKRQKPQPRDLEAMVRGQAAAPVQAQVLEAAQEVAPPKGMHRPHQAKWAAASGQPLHAPAETLIHAPGTASARPVKEFTTMGKGQAQFAMAQERRKREQEAEQHKIAFEAEQHRKFQEKQGVQVKPMQLSDPVGEQHLRKQRGQVQDERERMATEEMGYLQQHQRQTDATRIRAHAQEEAKRQREA